MNGEYERVVLGLEPWLRGVLRTLWEKVPGAYYLKPLGNEAEANGEAEGVAADLRGSVLEKALSVARDIESGRLRPRDKPSEQYFKQVMRHAIRDWLDAHPEAANLSSAERALIDNELYSIDTDEGGEGFSGLPTIRAPTGPRAPAQPPCPPLLTLMQQRFWRSAAVSTEYERVQELLNDIPDDRRREVVLLELQGYRQKQIAVEVRRTQQAVSKMLGKQYAIWGWDRKRVQWVQYLMVYVKLCRLIEEFSDEEDSYVGEWFDEEEGYDKAWVEEMWRHSLQRARRRQDLVDRAFELPREDEAYRHSRQPDSFLDGEERDRDQWWRPRLQQGSKEGRQEQDRLNRLKAQDILLYWTIMDDPALAPWTEGLELRHMPQLIAQATDY